MDGTSFIGILTKDELIKRLDKDLIIRPFLDKDKQINEVSLDFRLGYDFLVSVHGRDAYINASLNGENTSSKRGLGHHFQESRRQIGETFILHPNQTVLATSLEYVKLPDDLMLFLAMRSSYARLGITISTIVQPGYSGCISLELTNTNFTPINLTVGARLFQAVFAPTTNLTNYFSKTRKYTCQVRPKPSSALQDKDLLVLNALWKKANYII